VTAGDLDGDGDVDLAWSTTSGTLRRALNDNGHGTLWTFETLATMAGITQIKAADMEGDGDPDILSISPTAGIMRWHVNNGTSTWSPQNVDTGLTGVSAFACGQLTLVGRPEIVTLWSSGGIDRTDLHAWSGSAWIQTNYYTVNHVNASRAVTIADIDGPFATPEALFTHGDFSVRYFNTVSSFATLLYQASGFTHPTTAMTAVDWNQDGAPEVLIASTDGLELAQNGESAYVFDLPGSVDLLTSVSIQSVAVVDFNTDGWPDSAAVDTDERIHLIKNTCAHANVSTTTASTRAIVPGASGEIAATTVTRARHAGSPSPPLCRHRRRTDGTQYGERFVLVRKAPRIMRGPCNFPPPAGRCWLRPP
jgi:hypothetical protein